MLLFLYRNLNWRLSLIKDYSDNIAYIIDDKVEYIQFKNFIKYQDTIAHCFTTRIGGVSTGECEALNLGFNRNDTRENVIENYKRISQCLGIDYNNMVFSNQIHANKIKSIDENDRGKGIIFKSDIIGYDGLITNKRNVAIVTFYADCVPVFFFDPIKKVIAISHSGWRGTVKEIARETVIKMESEYGCIPKDIETAIGPSIGKCCFEVGEEVYTEFVNNLPWSEGFCVKPGNQNKWYIDLKGIIEQTLIEAEISTKKLCNSEICTKCNKDTFFSHRGDNGRTGSLAAIMQLK
jgi:YfiH family protein